VESVSSDDGDAILAAAAALRPVIRGYQEEIERERRIPPALMEHLRAAGLYRMVVPQELGGAQLDLCAMSNGCGRLPQHAPTCDSHSAVRRRAMPAQAGAPRIG